MEKLEKGKKAHAAGNFSDALKIYQEILSQEAGNSELHGLLGGLYQSTGDFALSEKHFKEAIRLEPENPDYSFYLANTLREMGQTDAALVILQEITEKYPNHAKSWYNLGNVWREKEEYDQAATYYEKAIAADPSYARAYINLGVTEIDRKNYDKAISILNKAKAIAPQMASIYNNLANAFSMVERFEDAIVAASRSIELDPQKAEAFNNLGSALRQVGRFKEGARAFSQATTVRHNYPRAHSNLGMTLLAMGDFARGWEAYEWRRNLEMPKNSPPPLLPEFPLAGKNLILAREQGLGDIIHFVRYAPLLAAIGGRVIVEAPKSLARLIKSCPGVSKVIEPKEELPGPIIKFPLLSLPKIFNTSIATIPALIPYLSPLKNEAEEWAEKLKDLPRPRIGLAWYGNPENDNDRHRSIPLEKFAPLFAAFPGANFISVQPGKIEGNFPVHDLLPDDADFATTAALMVNLEMIVSVDTAPLHLAGALGIPTLFLVQHIPDWRWLLEVNYSPWYPSLKIFRQETRGDWEIPIQAVIKDIKIRLNGPG